MKGAAASTVFFTQRGSLAESAPLAFLKWATWLFSFYYFDSLIVLCLFISIFNQGDDVDFSFISSEGGSSVGKRTSLTYEENVKEFILEEEQHIRDLNMLIKVFRSAFLSLRCHGVTEEDVDVIFRDIGDIHASVVNFHGLLEDMMEMTSENSVPSVPQVGTCFMEMAEGRNGSMKAVRARILL